MTDRPQASFVINFLGSVGLFLLVYLGALLLGHRLAG